MTSRRASRPAIIAATIATAVCFAILIGLGTWQLERKAWKENLIATMTARLNQPSQELPPRAAWPRLSQGTDEFRHVRFPAEFLPGEQALVYAAGSGVRRDITGPGYFVFAPARLAGGSIVVINRGFVPYDRRDAIARDNAPREVIDVVGAMRWSEPRGTFTPADEPKANVFYVRDLQAIARAKKWDTAAPFYIDQESPVPAGGLPLPGKLEINLPNNHLQYAVTWFGLALALAGVYVVWLAGLIQRRS